MKKLINKKTGEIAFIDLYTNTIYFSKSKTKHHAIISKNEFNQITKITALPQNGSEFISEPIPETKSEPISEPISEMISEPIINTPSEPISEMNSELSHNENLNTNSSESENDFNDEYTINELIPEMEYFDSPDSLLNTYIHSIYRIPA